MAPSQSLAQQAPVPCHLPGPWLRWVFSDFSGAASARPSPAQLAWTLHHLGLPGCPPRPVSPQHGSCLPARRALPLLLGPAATGLSFGDMVTEPFPAVLPPRHTRSDWLPVTVCLDPTGTPRHALRGGTRPPRAWAFQELRQAVTGVLLGSRVQAGLSIAQRPGPGSAGVEMGRPGWHLAARLAPFTGLTSPPPQAWAQGWGLEKKPPRGSRFTR